MRSSLAAGYEHAAPVRIGNAAADQLKLDVHGEVLDALYQARRMGLAPSDAAWNLERELVRHLEKIWDSPAFSATRPIPISLRSSSPSCASG
jgi:GH15 family glucan-1,4-alpha-glucosidase